jgi:2-polyprenyl-3-methyl-5-hydroxy-6-metoxy-1,4-benzoquinol methylase
VSNNGFYKSTGRDKVDSVAINKTQKSYTFNYAELLPTSIDARIVDLGCSEGISMHWLVQQGYQNVVGIDSDEYAIGIAKSYLADKVNDEALLAVDALEYLKKCDDSSIDMILMFNVIEHIPKQIILEVMAEIQRVLKEGGSFLAQTGNWENPFNIGLFTRDFTHEVMYTQNSLKQLMVMSGFQIQAIHLGVVRYKTTLRNFPLQVFSPIFGKILKIVALVMRIHIRETSPLIYCLVKK